MEAAAASASASLFIAIAFNNWSESGGIQDRSKGIMVKQKEKQKKAMCGECEASENGVVKQVGEFDYQKEREGASGAAARNK